MIQKHSELLFKDLCARLPYGVKVKMKYYDDAYELLAIYKNGTTYAARDIGYPIETFFEDCKPYLFPLSSMTDEQKDIFGKLWWNAHGVNMAMHAIDYLNKNHFDYRGLIGKGLAIDATGSNIY